ncbi:LADA_0C13014g1_1 [Lachancea dasiensis]|uniref:LADA_0C13014g1_1 n=1 Tax=Lachancea dasiensis TaxID=1072105 RepID=A0A1G4J2I6_9SACH|nr:LADA_0C13014g1_1 [Lachancea dasiensis]
MKTIFVSGATGFIALYVVNDLLQSGYKVIGSVRSQDKADRLSKQFKYNQNLSFVIVPDIAKAGAFDEAFEKFGKEISAVIHTASPFHFSTTEYEKDLLIPAVNGTKGILESIKKYAATFVERVVVTSSYAAICDFASDSDKTNTFTEESWNMVTWEEAKGDALTAYCGSKTFAEKEAWDFLESNKDTVSFKLTTINPVFVLGPQLFDENVSSQLNTSCEHVNNIVHSTPESKLDEVLFGGYIDVRDVSKAHQLAFERENLAGQRLILSEGRFTLQDIADTINADFPELRGKIVVGKPGSSKEKLSSIAKLDNSKTKALLGFKFKTFREAVDDTTAQILKMEKK